jgi:isochorismate synthase
VLERLPVRGDVVRFAIRRAGALFFGATPERLMSVRGRMVESEALAGTVVSNRQAAAGAPSALDALTQDPKQRLEHALVVDHLVSELRAHCAELSLPAAPTHRVLGEIAHLLTPLRGRLLVDRHVLSLVIAAHPTPAVAGVPTAPALELVRRHEPVERGWYAGAIGWFDGRGDGEFRVALRSCLLAERAGQAEAVVYAGAGLLPSSQPRLEWQETCAKRGAVLAALQPWRGEPA